MIPYKKEHLPTTSPKYSKLPLDWQYITIHNTGNPKSTARNERNYLTNPTNKTTTGFHIVLDSTEAIECLPLNVVAWHAGDGQNDNGNRKSIGIEFCESGDFEKTFTEGARIVAELLNSKGYDIDRIKKHKDWSGKQCPRLIIPRWDEFISLVRSNMMPEWERVLDRKLTSADEWVEVIASRIAHGKAVDSIEQYFGEFIVKLTK